MHTGIHIRIILPMLVIIMLTCQPLHFYVTAYENNWRDKAAWVCPSLSTLNRFSFAKMFAPVSFLLLFRLSGEPIRSIWVVIVYLKQSALFGLGFLIIPGSESWWIMRFVATSISALLSGEVGQQPPCTVASHELNYPECSARKS